MPTYDFRNKKTNEQFEKFMSISAKELFLAENPDIEQILQAPGFNYSGVDKKPDAGFRDILKEIRSKHDKRFTRSTINTF